MYVLNIMYKYSKLTIIPLLFLIQSQIFSITFPSSLVLCVRFFAEPKAEKYAIVPPS